MDVNKTIVDALIPLGYPVRFGGYDGTATIYITFNYEDDRAELYADDEPQEDVAYLMIHLFTPAGFDLMALKKQIRAKLFQAGFTYPTVQTFFEADTKTNHVVYQCSISGAPESEE